MPNRVWAGSAGSTPFLRPHVLFREEGVDTHPRTTYHRHDRIHGDATVSVIVVAGE